MQTQKTTLTRACDDFLSYHERILCPAAGEFFSELEQDRLPLHRAFAVNMLAAHAMDYLLAIRTANGEEIRRPALLKRFDELYAADGAALANQKFELVNFVNNSLKHVELDNRPANREALDHYGPIRFDVLIEEKGRVHCLLQRYRFDFGRVVLRSVLNPLTGLMFSNETDVVDFATGKWLWEDEPGLDPEDPIDQMIEHCNPPCVNCGESEDKCECATFVFDGKEGRFEPLRPDDYQFDFDAVMSQISGAYNKTGN